MYSPTLETARVLLADLERMEEAVGALDTATFSREASQAAAMLHGDVLRAARAAQVAVLLIEADLADALAISEEMDMQESVNAVPQ